MRIIAGAVGGRRLEAPKGMDTRPTLDRVKESLFSMLQPHLQDADVLDLFAGSGALGLEAISRGARFAVLCDVAAEPCRVIARNIAALQFEEKSQLLHAAWGEALHQLDHGGKCFHVVFLDPPYRMTGTLEMCLALRNHRLLRPGAIVCIEHDIKQTPILPEVFSPWKERRFGETMLHLFQFQEAQA